MTTLHQRKSKTDAETRRRGDAAKQPQAAAPEPRVTVGPEAHPPAAPIDARIDQLGFVGELQKQFADDLKTQVKTELLGKELDRARGECFEALLVQGTTQTVDPAKFLAGFEKGRITRAQFLNAISVRRDAALDCLGRDDLAKISTEAPASPQLRINRIKGVEVTLVKAVESLAKYVPASRDLHPT